ncbi:MAG TPA: hypothetical protein VM779_06875 [Thermoanaerobaculia bacterium]|nr:hypothetical protein [Thermoanaerobaculia bacterium]
MTLSRPAAAALLLLLVAGCGMFGGGRRGAPAPRPEPPSFLNRVWRVVEAKDIAVGTYYVFLSDNTLLITPPGATTPRLGRWHFAAGGLAVIEEGYRYPADILEAGEERFAIRIHRGDESEDVVMVGVR